MNELILCEGKTDAILLSYYLGRMSGWAYARAPKGLEIRKTNDNEELNWYKKGDDYLLICGVGGKDNFGNFFKEKIMTPIVTTNAFDMMAVITDRDYRTIEDIEENFKDAFDSFAKHIKNQVWCENKYIDSFGMEQCMLLLLLVVPSEHQGALEMVMLDAISEIPYDKAIVDKSCEFVKKMRIVAGKYITTDRLQLKAHLGVTWAVQYPEKVFSLIDEQIKTVRWEESRVLKECFGMLCDI